MTAEATQRAPAREANGGSLRVMTSKPSAQDPAAAKSNGPKAASSQKAGADGGSTKSPKKRRKVNHACIYCRRSHMTCDLDRPCTRCIKRNIGHLCHDEPREPAKKHKQAAQDVASRKDDAAKLDRRPSDSSITQRNNSNAGLNLALPIPQDRLANAVLAQPTPVSASAPQVPSLTNSQPFLNYHDWSLGGHNHFHDMHTLHPSYMFNTEVTNEYNLLNDFLSNSLLEEGATGLYSGDEYHGLLSEPPAASMNALSGHGHGLFAVGGHAGSLMPPSHAAVGSAISRPASGFPMDKARETYYMTAADPVGTESPEERMNKLLKAKYDAGMLKPFNYVKGYARLNQYIERTLRPPNRQKILRQLDKFRPKFRERIQSLTDIELVRVEMWFERSLMEYDRVFASMAIPACCWRRTGEIFKGNKEMAELINVPIERLREGKIAIHEIIAEGSLVSYWEKFGAIAFDSSQKAILTTCSLKRPDSPGEPEIRCCFSFTIRRDSHNIPSLIVGNFLPIHPDS